MESAIPADLRSERTRSRRIPDDYSPPYPSFVARFKPAVKQVVMAYFGIQFAGEAPPSAGRALAWIAQRFSVADGASHWDRARYTDEAGYATVVSVGYWNDPSAFERWFTQAREDWMTKPELSEGLGRFIEVLSPNMDGFETLFSSLGRPEGVATIAETMSGEVQEHAYWGGMRDRIPRSQRDAMSPTGSPSVVRDGDRIRVFAGDNICLIRSGEDWTDTGQEERAMYLDDVEPVLREGMDFLRDEGRDIGCYANRYMVVENGDGIRLQKTYGMSWWRSLADLERWAESHPTHVAIFGAAMKYLSTLGPAAKLRLYHEVSVARVQEQFFEYSKCHPETGMLRAIKLG